MPKRVNDEICPICDELMEVRCTGFSNSPFVDGNKYMAICFTCFSLPKRWEVKRGKAEDGSQDVWEGPFFDCNHLYTPEEILKEGACDDIRKAKKSYKALIANIKKAKKKGKIEF